MSCPGQKVIPLTVEFKERREREEIRNFDTAWQGTKCMCAQVRERESVCVCM